jgi:phosphate transport system permease protein
LITAVILGIARAVGETAPLIMTSFGATDMNVNPFEGAQASLPLSVYQLISNPFAAQQQRAYAGALVLVLLVLVLFTAARILGRSRKPKPAALPPVSRLETDS